MKNAAILCAMGSLLVAADPLLAQRGGRDNHDNDAAKFGWQGNLEQAKFQAQKTGKPILLVFRCVP